MGNNLRKLKIGFVNLLMLGNFEKEAEEIAVKHSIDAKNYLSEKLGVDVISSIEAITNFEQAKAEWEFLKSRNADGVVLFHGTFSLSNLMIEIIRNLDVPFLAWGLEEYLVSKNILSGSMIGLMPTGMVFKELKKNFSFAYGTIADTKNNIRVNEFIDAVRAVSYMREAKIGLIGSRPDGFEIAGFDELAIKRIFGATITKFSMNDFLASIDSFGEKDVLDDMKKQKELFEISEENFSESKNLSKVYLAAKKLSLENKLSAYAPQCWPELRMNRKTPMCTANGRMTAEGVMASCEADMDCALTMLLLYSLTNGSTPWTADFVNYIKDLNSLLFWHCGNASYNLSRKKPKIEIVFEGLAQTAVAKPGIATVCRVNHSGNNFKIFAGLGSVIDSGPVFKGSNLLINMSAGNFEYIEAMLENGIPHHNVIVYGNVVSRIKEFAKHANIPVVIAG